MPLDTRLTETGRDGEKAVPYVCPSPAGATLTFEFRVWPNLENPGSIDDSHQGPCAVYLKKMDDMFSDSASGPGWFKIWEDGYSADSEEWCVDKLIKNDGLLSVELPTGLPAGYYLVRPELIALHQAYRGDPQFFHSCAQIFVEKGPETSLEVPDKYSVSIPGYIKEDAPGLTFNLYEDSPSDYVIPGPDVFIPSSRSSGVKKTQADGKVPDSCLIKNGNWCAEPVPKSSDVESCWDSVDACWAQSKTCWDSVPVTGDAGCEVWADYCEELGDSCDAGDYDGPAEFQGEEQFASSPASMPQVYNSFKRTEVNGGSGDESDAGSEAANPGTIIAVPEEKEEEEPEPSAVVEPQPSESSTLEDETDGSNELKVSEDGRCGGETGQTCVGSSFGDCCSKKGRCGRKTRHCTCGCQGDFGECRQ